MKTLVACLAALSFADPAFAQEWPNQDWYVLAVPSMAGLAPTSTLRDGGAYPPYQTMSGPEPRRISPGLTGRENVALNINSISRSGDQVEVVYFVWPDQKSDYTEITSRIDCSRTGERVVLLRSYDRDLAHVRTSDGGFRRTDATSRAVANQVCHLPRGHRVSGKSLPEIARGD